MALTQALLDEINTLSGYDLFRDVGIAWRKQQFEWIHALLQRAKFLTRNRFGSWEQAQKIIQTYDPLKIDWTIGAIDLPNVLGYPCQAVSYGDKGNYKQQSIVIFSHKEAFIHYFIKDSLPVF